MDFMSPVPVQKWAQTHSEGGQRTPPTFVRDTEVHDKVDRPRGRRGVREKNRQLDVSAPPTPRG